MRLLSKNSDWDFLARRRVALILSGGLIVLSLASLAFRGLALGVDFTGGTIIEVGYSQAVELPPIRQLLADSGYEGALVQHFGTARDVMIRLATQPDVNSADLSTKLLALLGSISDATVAMRRIEFVGPQIGEELTEDGGLAMLFALIAIMVYVTMRFEWRFSLGSVAALVHDVIITIGLFSIFQLDFDLSVLAAVLAVIGYSLNDTIVVFDRIRENFRKMRKATPEQVINISLNQTLSRTLMTSITTLLVLVALFVFGGETIHGFATALIFGVVVGTYSSIYVASPIALALGVSRSDLMSVPKEGAEGAERDLP